MVKIQEIVKEKLTEFYMDIAASIQELLRNNVENMQVIKEEYKIPNLCLAGGVALNCVANGKIYKEKFLKIFGYSRRQGMQVVQLAHTCLLAWNWAGQEKFRT